MNYDQQNKFYNHALKIVEKMGGRISAHGNLHGIFLSVIVFHDSTYEKTRDILNTMFRKISENEQLKEIMDLMKKSMNM